MINVVDQGPIRDGPKQCYWNENLRFSLDKGHCFDPIDQSFNIAKQYHSMHRLFNELRSNPKCFNIDDQRS